MHKHASCLIKTRRLLETIRSNEARQMYVPHVRSFNKAYIILVILPACLSLFCMCAEVKRAGVPLSLKETALTSMTFFSCLARHHTPAHERALAPQTAKLQLKAGLEFWNMGHWPVRREILSKTAEFLQGASDITKTKVVWEMLQTSSHAKRNETFEWFVHKVFFVGFL